MNYQLLKQKIQIPCSQDWDSMDATIECGTVKFCQVCQKNVTDVSDMSLKAVKKLATESNGEICIKISKPPIYRYWSKILAKSAAIGFIFLGTFGGQDLLAQKNRTDEPYQITQVATKLSTIIISGTVKGERTLGWKKLEKVSITLFSEEGLKIGEYETDSKGNFLIKVEKNLLGNHFDISFTKSEYEWHENRKSQGDKYQYCSIYGQI